MSVIFAKFFASGLPITIAADLTPAWDRECRIGRSYVRLIGHIGTDSQQEKSLDRLQFWVGCTTNTSWIMPLHSILGERLGWTAGIVSAKTCFP